MSRATLNKMVTKISKVIFSIVIILIAAAVVGQVTAISDETSDAGIQINQTYNNSTDSSSDQIRYRKDKLNKTQQNISPRVSKTLKTPSAADNSSANRITVHIISKTNYTSDVANAVQQHDGQILANYENRLLADLPITALTEIKDSSTIRYIKYPEQSTQMGGPIVSEGASVVDAQKLHSQGYTGDNATVAVIDQDGGFNQRNPEIADNIVSTYDPTLGEGVQNRSGEHGTAVAETVVDTAPNASLILAEIDGSIEVAQTVDYLRTNTSTDVIVMSLGFGSGPFDGSGFMGNAILDARNDGIPMFISAGNSADGQHLNTSWSDGNSNDILNFTRSDETLNIRGSGPIFVNWDDFPDSNNDYDVFLYDQSGSQIDNSRNIQNGRNRPIETVLAQNCPCQLLVTKYDASGSAEFDIFAYNAEFEYNTSAQSITRPATDEAAITVGAAYYQTLNLEAFSSRGPTVDGRQKPELVAPDGASNSVYGNFYGTSQAAPHAAGAAALLKSVNTSFTPDQIESALKQTAKQTDSRYQLPSPNNQTGDGLVNVSAALTQLQGNSTQTTRSTISVANASATSGMNTSVGVTVDTLPNGLRTYNITLSVANGTVATIGDINAGAIGGAQFEIVSQSATSATLRASDLSGSVQSGAANVSLGTLGLHNTTEGSTNISVSVNSMTDDSGTQIDTVTNLGQLTVSPQQQNVPPTAVFSPTQGPITNGSVVTFNATASTDSDGSISRYEWDLNGDGTIDRTGAVTSYQYNTSGRVSVTLNVTDNDGATDTRTEQLLIIEDTNTTATVSLTSAPNGLQKYSVSLTSTKGPVLGVTPQLITGPAFQFLTEIGDQTATVRGSDIARAVGSFNNSRVLVTITFAGDLNRSDLTRTVNALTDDQSNPIPSSQLDISVGELFTTSIPGTRAQGPPTDPDGDGLYEDIDGDNQVTFNDAVALSFATTGSLNSAQQNALDFDRDGDVDFTDAVELSFQT